MPIFTQFFLTNYLSDFHLSSVADLQRKKDILENWFSALETKKLEYFKEEEVKSRFILEIFGEVLGFNYKNTQKWHIREEYKSGNDATKADAAIGMFHIHEKGITNEVHLIIEIKNAKTILDKPQNRKAFNVSPVDQGFLYASKTEGLCKWVVVSNFKEIRFYSYQSQLDYQAYTLESLQDDQVLKEFLYLFSKERLISNSKSTTDKLYEYQKFATGGTAKESHVLEELYQMFKKFDRLKFVDPDFLCNLKPLNILDEHVWHYKNNRLLTLNPEITTFLESIQKEGNSFKFTSAYLKELKKAKVAEPEIKLNYIFYRLRECLIAEIAAVKDLHETTKKAKSHINFSFRYLSHFNDKDLIVVESNEQISDKCDCINCRFRRFDFKDFIKYLNRLSFQSNKDPMEEAYGHYLISTEGYKKSYHLYKEADIKYQDSLNDKIAYFISKINQTRLHNLVEFDDDESTKDILAEIRTIDLDRSIHNELDIYVDNDIRKYLIEIKENKLFAKISDMVEPIAKTLEESAGKTGDVNQLIRGYQLLYSQFHKNYLVFDVFGKFKLLARQVLGGIFSFYKANKNNEFTFPSFFLTEAILYGEPKTLKTWIEGIETLKIDILAIEDLITQTVNLLSSLFTTTTFGQIKDRLMAAQLLNHSFEELYSSLIYNSFTLLAKLEINAEQKEQLSKPLYYFLKTEDFLHHYDLEAIGIFLERHGDLFKPHMIHELLQVGINYDNYGTHKYSSINASLAKAFKKFFSGQILKDQSLIKRAIANSTHETGRMAIHHLIPLYAIVDEPSKQFLLETFEQQLNADFNEFTYYDLMEEGVINWDHKDLFTKYIDYAKHMGPSYAGVKDGNTQYKNVAMINLIYKVYQYGISVENPEFKKLSELPEFERWALFPETFNENNFNPEWLLAVNSDIILPRLRQFKYIHIALNKHLADKFDLELSKIYFKLIQQ